MLSDNHYKLEVCICQHQFEKKYKKFETKLSQIKELIEKLSQLKLTPSEEINNKLLTIPTVALKDGITIYNLLKRNEVTVSKLQELNLININYPKEVIEEVEITIKYEGYINKVEREAERMLKNEAKQIPDNIDYNKIPNLASEARQKLNEVRPTSIGQALRISGVNPADISILMIYLRKDYNE